MSELKPLPCPFCGGTVRIKREPENMLCFIVCDAGSACQDSDLHVGFTPEKEVSAIEAWNRRAQPAQAGQVLTDDQWQRIADITQTILTRGIRDEIEAVLAKRVPMMREEVKELARKVGYDNATAQERADFINGIRHAEVWHGIVGEKGGA